MLREACLALWLRDEMASLVWVGSRFSWRNQKKKITLSLQPHSKLQLSLKPSHVGAAVS